MTETLKNPELGDKPRADVDFNQRVPGRVCTCGRPLRYLWTEPHVYCPPYICDSGGRCKKMHNAETSRPA